MSVFYNDVYMYEDKRYYFIDVMENVTNNQKVILYADDKGKQFIRDLNDFKEKFKREKSLKDYTLKDFLYTDERNAISSFSHRHGIRIRTKKCKGFYVMVANLLELRNLYEALNENHDFTNSKYYSHSTLIHATNKIKKQIELIENEAENEKIA